MNFLISKAHLVFMPLYDWNDFPVAAQMRAAIEVLKSEKRMGALLILTKMLLLVVVNAVAYPVGVILSVSRYRILAVDLSQLGSVLYLDVKVKKQILNSPNHRYIVPINPLWNKNNKALINLYRPYVTYAESLFSKILLFPFYFNRFLTENTKEIDGKDSQAHKYFTQYRAKLGSEPLITLSDEQKNRCKEVLAKEGIDGDFVTIHVRDSGFYDENRRSMRNADINTYYDALDFLVKSGYKVVRIGSPKSQPVSSKILSLAPDFLDLSKSASHTEELDIYLLSEAVFFVGTASGPFTIASVLDTPVLVTNHVSPADSLHLREGDLSLFKKYTHPDGKNVNLIHLFGEKLRFNPHPHKLEEFQLRVLDNSPDEILTAVKEFCRRLSDPNIPTPLNDQIRTKIQALVPEAVWRPGKFSEDFLSSYITNQSQF